jgi:DoxX-like family
MSLLKVHRTARVTLALLWIYQGLVPKLLVQDSGELLLAKATVGEALARPCVIGAGVAEIAIGVALLLLSRARTLVWASAIIVSMLTIVGTIATPHIAVTPFNSISLTGAMLALGAIVLQTMPE